MSGPGLSVSATAARNLATATVTSVTATTVVYPLVGADGAMADGVGTIEIQATESVMMDLSHVFAAQQRMPSARVVPYWNRTSDALQVASIWGRIGRAGRVRVINSPPTSA